MILWVWLALAQAPPIPEERPILDEIQAYDEQIVALDAQIAALDADRATREQARSTQLVAAEQARAKLDAERGGVRALVRAYYTLARRGLARLVFDAESPTELRRRVFYLGSLVRRHQARLEGYATLVSQRAEADRRVAEETEALGKLRAELDGRRAQLDAERQRRLDLLRAVRASRELSARVAVEHGQAVAELDRSVAMREATLPAAAAAGPAAAFRAARGRLPRPTAGQVVAGFGPQPDPVTGETRNNLGMDFAAPPGTPFRAVFDGQVTRSGYVRGYGQVVMVQHGAYTTLYAHANGLRVAQGQEVRQGDVLGLVGTTGLVSDDQARLHFEIRYNGTPQDPAEWLAP